MASSGSLIRVGSTSFLGIAGILFWLLPAPLFGVLAALLGPWLKRYYPFSQALLFGLIGVAVCAVLMLTINIVVNAVSNACRPPMGCAEPINGAIAVTMFAGPPLAVMAGFGLGLAIRISNSRRGAKIVILMALLVIALAFSAAQILGLLRPVI